MTRTVLLCLAVFTTSLAQLTAQSSFAEIQPSEGSPFLVGHIPEALLLNQPYASWYGTGLEAYRPDPSSLEELKSALEPYHILVFLGTWCGDSRREVPRFMKILQESGFPAERVKIVTVDRREEHYKKSLNGEEWGLDIRRVPTFIFLREGREANRIVEKPLQSLEADMLAILRGDPYTPRYARAGSH